MQRINFYFTASVAMEKIESFTLRKKEEEEEIKILKATMDITQPQQPE